MANCIRKSALKAVWPAGLSAMQYADLSGRVIDQTHYCLRLIVGCIRHFNFKSEVWRRLKRVSGPEWKRGADCHERRILNLDGKTELVLSG